MVASEPESENFISPRISMYRALQVAISAAVGGNNCIVVE